MTSDGNPMTGHRGSTSGDESATTGLVDALAYALTGVTWTFATEGPDAPDMSDIADRMAASGWPAERVAAHARETLDSDGVWPHPIAPDLLAELGAARFQAALADLRRRLGVWLLTTRPPSRRTVLDADERRLLAEVPPHHVR